MNIDISTYFIYLFLLMVMVSSSLLLVNTSISGFDTAKPAYWGLKIYVVIVFYAVFVGLRYNVGRDYSAYLGWYRDMNLRGHFAEAKEIGYTFLNKCLAILNAEYYFLFISIAFLQIFFLFKSLEKLRFLIPWYMFFFFTSLLMFSSLNIMRQTVAYFIFFYTIILFIEKKYILTVVFLILGFSFHKSIALFIWVYPLLKYDWVKNKYLQLIILIFAAFFATKIVEVILSYISPIVNLLGYSYYTDNSDFIKDITSENTVGSGLGKYLMLFIDTIIILYSSKLKFLFKTVNFTAFYNIYFVGIILERLLVDNFILARTNDYFADFRVLILSFLCYYLSKNKSNPIKNISILTVIVISMMAYFFKGIDNSAANCAPFQFIPYF